MAIEVENGNVYHAGQVGFEALFDKILVLEDEFRSGYECETCDGTSSVKCPDCEDGSSRLNPAMQCKSCHRTMLVVCPTCKGKSVEEGGLVLPDVSKRRPTTGTIVSAGSEVEAHGLLKLGDSVLYPSFCGEVMDLSGLDQEGRESTVVLRMLKEREVIGRVHGHLELRRVRKQQFQTSG